MIAAVLIVTACYAGAIGVCMDYRARPFPSVAEYQAHRTAETHLWRTRHPEWADGRLFAECVT